jgi:signal peptidase II
MNKTRGLSTAMAVILIALDQLIKDWALTHLRPVGSITVIPGLFCLTYVENRGAAFGILQGNTRLLSIITGMVMIVALIVVYSGRLRGNFLIYTVMLIIAGGLGNLIDRVSRGFVVDYLDFSALFGFPVFNLADCCVVAGTLLLIFYILIFERRESKRAGQSL